MTESARAVVRLPNERGLHARPCSAIVSAALQHVSDLRVRCGGREADGRSILSLMTLAAPHGAELELEATGEDARVLIARLTELVRTGFGQLD